MCYFKQDIKGHPTKQYIITRLLAKWQNLMFCVTMATGYERFPPNLCWRYAKHSTVIDGLFNHQNKTNVQQFTCTTIATRLCP